jgi:hypothetical protein
MSEPLENVNHFRAAAAWHYGCSTCRNINQSEEQSMKLLLATMFKKVPVRTTKQRATLCKRCGARIYSLSYLKAHLEAHDRKNH